MQVNLAIGALCLTLLAPPVTADVRAEIPAPAYDPAEPVGEPSPPESRNVNQEIRELLRPDRKIFTKTRTLDERTQKNKIDLKASRASTKSHVHQDKLQL